MQNLIKIELKLWEEMRKKLFCFRSYNVLKVKHLSGYYSAAIIKYDHEGPDHNPNQPAKFDPNRITTLQIMTVTDRRMDGRT